MSLSASALSRLQYQHTTIRELIAGLTGQELEEIAQPGKWSVFDNIAHLSCYQVMFIRRLERIATEDAPAFERYVADNDPSFSNYRELSLAELLTGLDKHRTVILTKLRGMHEDELRRVGHHPKYGSMDVPAWTEFFLLHEAHHLYTIFMLIYGRHGT